MNMELPEVVTSVVEEVWYLSHNKKFITAVEKLRKKHNVVANANFNFDQWEKLNIKDNNFDPLQNLNHDIVQLVSKCRIGKSKYQFELWHSVREFIFTNELTVFWNGISAAGLPNVDIETSQGRVILTLFLRYDANKKDIDKTIRGSWQKIRKAQKELAGQLLEHAPEFETNVKIWERNKSFPNNEDQIAFELMNGDSKYELRKLVKRMNKRIDTSFE